MEANPVKQFRGLATRGVLADPSPYDLPDDAWSRGINVRFAGTKAMRSPVFRAVDAALTDTPAFVVGSPSSTGYDKIVYVGPTGRIWSYFAGVVTEVTPTVFTPVVVQSQFTSSFLGDVLYINNPLKGLYFQGPAGGNFARDPQWDATWSAAVFRVYKDYPIALNVTKGAQNYPTMVKWGDPTLAGLTTLSWDATDPTKNSGETPISDLTGPIIDGQPMKDVFVIYSQEQVWEMIAAADTSVFRFNRLFSEGGIIGVNCVCEVNGRHYVFGPNDIYMHDGVTKTSLLDKRNHEFVYRNLVSSQIGRFFAFHMPNTHEIMFAYVSNDPDVGFPSPDTGCNRGLVYNYVDDVMSPVDLPNVTMMAMANLNSVLTWGGATGVTWGTIGGSWASQRAGYSRLPVAASGVSGVTVTADRLLAYDFMDKGTTAFPYLPELNPPAVLERTGIDLDDEQAGLNTYKVINRVFPQVVMFRGVPLTVQVGASVAPSGPVTWASPVLFDPTSQYKVDFRKGGRYVAIRFTVSQAADFEVSGFDAELVSAGSR